MKRLIIFFLVLVSMNAISQPVINRALQVNTVNDARLMASRNFYLPRYIDTTSANLDKGIDSCGAQIFTYTNNLVWIRACNPKRWIQGGGGGGGSLVTDNTESVTLSGTGDALDPLIADVNISTTGQNALVLLPDGLYVPNSIRNGVIYGGAVTWISGYSYEVQAAGYYINGVFYTSPTTTVTLDSADVSLDRIDVFAVDNTGTVVVLTGTPAANPEQPDVDIATQLEVSFAFVQAGTTEPANDSTGLRRECIYQENTEWTAAASTTRINPNSTSNPCVGLKSVEGTAVIGGDNILFTRPGGAITILDSFQVITFQIKSKGNWGNQNRRLQFKFELSGTTVGGIVNLSGNSYGFSSNLLTCQTVSIPLVDFGITAGSTINSLRITAALSNGSIGWYIDQICMQNQPQPIYATPITLQNGLNLDPATNIGELGGTLLHNTTNYTASFVHTFSGATVYDYPYQLQQVQSFQNSTSVASFLSAGSLLQPNSVRLGINFTGPTYQTSGPYIPGYAGGTFSGYFLGTNLKGHGSFGLDVDDSSAKKAGIFFHTKDNSIRDAVSIYGADSSGVTGYYGDMANSFIASFKTDKNIQFYGYDSLTRNDGVLTKVLGTDELGNVILGTVQSGAGGSSSVTIGENRTSTVVDKQTYSGFPSVAWTATRDTIFLAWKDGTNHADDGALMFTYSIDGGSTYVPYDTIYVDGSPAIGGTVEIGYMQNRLAIIWTKGANYTRIRAAYNDGRDRNFTGVDSVAAPAATLFAPYGAMVSMPSGKFMFTAYTWNSPADSTKAIFLETADNGLTWSIGATIVATNAAGTFPQMAISETYVIRVEDTATTDAATKMVALIRSDTYIGYHVLSYSTGGVTWTNTAVSGGVWAFGSQNAVGLPGTSGTDAAYPATMILDKGYVYATVDRRGEGPDYSSRVWKTAPSSIFNNTPNFYSYRTIYRALDAYKGSDIDWGYGRLFVTQTGELKKISYDMSVSDRPGVDGSATSKRIRLAVNPVRGINAFEAFAAANQSISSGTETVVTTDYIWLDTDSSYNADSAKIYIPTDGYYEVTARVRFDTSSLGTYRQAKLYAVDWGSAYGLTPTRAPYLLDKVTFQPSTTNDFNYIFLKSTKYLYKGMQIKLTVQQDSGGGLNILSSAYAGYPQTDDGRATLTFKKIN